MTKKYKILHIPTALYVECLERHIPEIGFSSEAEYTFTNKGRAERILSSHAAYSVGGIDGEYIILWEDFCDILMDKPLLKHEFEIIEVDVV